MHGQGKDTPRTWMETALHLLHKGAHISIQALICILIYFDLLQDFKLKVAINKNIVQEREWDQVGCLLS